VRALLISAPAEAVDFNPSAPLDPSQINDRRCDGELCVFEHTNFGGKVVYYQWGSKDMRNPGPKEGPPFNDMVSSIYNGSDKRYCVFTDANYKGHGWFVEPKRMYRDIGKANDVISSVAPCK
jgi:hypothetical protein